MQFAEGVAGSALKSERGLGIRAAADYAGTALRAAQCVGGGVPHIEGGPRTCRLRREGGKIGRGRHGNLESSQKEKLGPGGGAYKMGEEDGEDIHGCGAWIGGLIHGGAVAQERCADVQMCRRASDGRGCVVAASRSGAGAVAFGDLIGRVWVKGEPAWCGVGAISPLAKTAGPNKLR